MNAMSKASEMKVADMKDTLIGFKFLTPEETKQSMESGNLKAFLDCMGTPKGNVDTSFLPLESEGNLKFNRRQFYKLVPIFLLKIQI